MSAQTPPVVTLAKLQLEHWTQGSLYESRDTAFGAALGLKDLGIGYGEVPPGKSGCPFHSHHVEDELFVILEGHGTYRYGGERYLVGPGDVLGAPAGGPETAHQIINTGTVPLKYLSISSMASTEICEYPDSGKFLAKTRRALGGRTEFRTIGHTGKDVDYWEGEPGA
ncbi:cupin domain-containing protein [Shinella sp. CPCC 101442]|uniref:cupin domain-containing protein n=1 Tax=Shinella sp. CPCC 101442 TaxID=2932265 RepID=UPI0021522F3B|nr:cupin domain-containing protein [Shinella sp. CPCC 101442]MCR6498682.1 cupin domain-containing protein [Shinella sp. CPCC 101442]